MSAEQFDIDHIAALARLKLTDEEKSRLGKHMHQIIDYIDQLNQLDTSQVEPTSHILPLQNVFREDEERDLFAGKNYLEQAPANDKGHYEVPQIIT